MISASLNMPPAGCTPTYPYLGKSSNGTVILFTASHDSQNDVGTVLVPTKYGQPSYPIGYRAEWLKSAYPPTPVGTTVTIKQV